MSDFLSLEKDLTSLGVVKSVDAIQEYGLPSSIGTDDGENLPFLDLKADTQKSLDTPESHAEIVDL